MTRDFLKLSADIDVPCLFRCSLPLFKQDVSILLLSTKSKLLFRQYFWSLSLTTKISSVLSTSSFHLVNIVNIFLPSCQHCQHLPSILSTLSTSSFHLVNIVNIFLPSCQHCQHLPSILSTLSTSSWRTQLILSFIIHFFDGGNYFPNFGHGVYPISQVICSRMNKQKIRFLPNTWLYVANNIFSCCTRVLFWS